MSSSRFDTYPKDDTRRLIGFSMSFSPENLIPKIRAEPGWLGVNTAQFIRLEMTKNRKLRRRPMSVDIESILGSGIRDIDVMVQHVIGQKSAKFTQDSLIALFEKDETTATIAAHARLPGWVLSSLLESNLTIDTESTDSALVHVDEVSGSLQTTNNFKTILEKHPAMPERGCPYAGGYTERPVDPMFVSFSKWASKLSILNTFSDDPIV